MGEGEGEVEEVWAMSREGGELTHKMATVGPRVAGKLSFSGEEGEGRDKWSVCRRILLYGTAMEGRGEGKGDSFLGGDTLWSFTAYQALFARRFASLVGVKVSRGRLA